MKSNSVKDRQRLQEEYCRLDKLAAYEEALMDQGYGLVAGIDEAGRGPLAGPVVAGAVILPKGIRLPGLNDSKKVSVKNRERLEAEIKAQAIAWAIGEATPDEIDRFNILEATKIAMLRAIDHLQPKPAYLLIDALKLNVCLPQDNIIQGDAKCACISAASILAKTHRDRLMAALDQVYPDYALGQNKGYPTKQHRLAVAQLGPSPCHRRSFLSFVQKMELKNA